MDRKSPELIEQDMHETRQALTDKVAALEQQVVGTIHGATSAVQETVQSVKSAVEETVCSVKDRVKESVSTVQESVATASANVKATLDVPEHIRHRPWAAVAGATVVGVIAGYALSRNENKPKIQSAHRTTGTGNGQTPRPPVFSAPAQPGTIKPGFFDEIIERVRNEVKQLSEAAITALSQSLQQNLHQGINQVVQNVASFGFGSAQSHEDRPEPRERHNVGNGATSGVRS